MSQWSLLYVLTLHVTSSSRVGWAQRLASRQEAKMLLLWLGFKRVISLLLANSISFSDHTLWQSKLPCWRHPQGKELKVAFGQQPVRNWGLQSYNLSRSCILPTLCEWAGGWLSPWLTFSLAASWETMKQKTHLSWILAHCNQEIIHECRFM